MARSVNKAIVLGHLGKDAETRFTQSGVAVTNVSVATSRRWKDQSGDWKEETDWHNIVAWRQENLANSLTKGKQVYVEGRLQTRSFEDQDGVKRYVTEIVADEVLLLGGQNGAYHDAKAPAKGNQNSTVPQPRGRGAAASAPPADEFGGQGISDDDVPF